jgi:hypothetical protein
VATQPPGQASPTPTPGLGATVFQGTIQVAFIKAKGDPAQNEADEYVELRNVGNQPVYMDGWSLKAIRNDNTIVDTYLFQSGAVMAAGQMCRIYTNLPAGPDNCGFTSGFASDTPIWPDSGARASLFNQQNIEQARYTI